MKLKERFEAIGKEVEGNIYCKCSSAWKTRRINSLACKANEILLAIGKQPDRCQVVTMNNGEEAYLRIHFGNCWSWRRLYLSQDENQGWPDISQYIGKKKLSELKKLVHKFNRTWYANVKRGTLHWSGVTE